MKTTILAAALILTSASALADQYASIGYGGRPSAVNGYLGEQFTPNLGVELDYINEGKQPNGIPNDNQVLSLNAVASTPLYKSLSVYGKAGIADMRQRPDLAWSGMTGYQLGVGIKQPLAYSISMFAEIDELHTQQVTGQFENFIDLAPDCGSVFKKGKLNVFN